jgi:hypothetical protein
MHGESTDELALCIYLINVFGCILQDPIALRQYQGNAYLETPAWPYRPEVVRIMLLSVFISVRFYDP